MCFGISQRMVHASESAAYWRKYSCCLMQAPFNVQNQKCRATTMVWSLMRYLFSSQGFANYIIVKEMQSHYGGMVAYQRPPEIMIMR
jgi:hypothetical protein